MKKHFYLSCTGNIYSSLESIDGCDEPCTMCGDSDVRIDHFSEGIDLVLCMLLLGAQRHIPSAIKYSFEITPWEERS